MYSSTLHSARFAVTRSNGAVAHTSRSGPIPLDQLRRLAPSVFAETPHESRSAKYSYIPTANILEGLMAEGFQPYSVIQGGSRDTDKRGFTKHLLRLRHASGALQAGGTYNEILLLNSHDGTSSYRIMGGVFRLICLNGLTAPQSIIPEISVPHKGDIMGQVIDGCVSILDQMPAVTESIREMSAIQLSPGEQTAFARAALQLRYEDGAAPVTPEQVLAPRRAGDNSSDLWGTLNRTQESLIRGGLRYIQRDAHGRPVARRETRPIHGIDQNTAINRALATLAAEMAALKAA